MHIGIDAKWYFSGPSSGKVVVKNLVDNLIEQNTLRDKNATITLFVLSKELDKFHERFSNSISAGYLKIVPVKGFFNFFINIFQLQKVAIKNKVDVLLYQNYVPLFPDKKVKTIAYIHDFLFIDYPQFFTLAENVVYRLMVYLAHKADHIVTISNSEKQRIVRCLSISEDKVSVVYHGVSDAFKQYGEIEKKNIRLKYNLPEKFILYLGRINARKNISVLVESLKDISMDIPLVLIGKKDHKSFDIDKCAKENGVDSKIILLGYLPEEDLVKILASATIFCFPSYVEGFGLPPLEAMRTGTPVITTNGTSLPEVCEDAVIYFAPHDSKELAIAIEDVLNNDELRTDLIKRGLRQSAKFTWDVSINKLLSIFYNL